MAEILGKEGKGEMEKHIGVIFAGGVGQRMNSNENSTTKQFLKIINNKIRNEGKKYSDFCICTNDSKEYEDIIKTLESANFRVLIYLLSLFYLFEN